MNKEKETKSNKKSLIQYGVLALIALTLYLTGLHVEVISFVQRGILSTGLLNPDVEELTSKNSTVVQADFDFELVDEQGRLIHLSDLKGNVIFLNTWATWCPPCLAEMPNIADLHEEMGDEVAFVMLSLDKNFQNAINFNKDKDYNLPLYSATRGIPSMYQSSAIPTTYIINAQGNLVLTHALMADYNTAKFKKFLRGLK